VDEVVTVDPGYGERSHGIDGYGIDGCGSDGYGSEGDAVVVRLSAQRGPTREKRD
jgi:hypothetical protein